MTLNLNAIFGPAPATIPATRAIIAPVVDSAGTPAVAPVAGKPWPIIAGTEHFSIWISDDPNEVWPEFVPGVHYDIRQPSRWRRGNERPLNPKHLD